MFLAYIWWHQGMSWGENQQETLRTHVVLNTAPNVRVSYKFSHPILAKIVTLMPSRACLKAAYLRFWQRKVPGANLNEAVWKPEWSIKAHQGWSFLFLARPRVSPPYQPSLNSKVFPRKTHARSRIQLNYQKRSGKMQKADGPLTCIYIYTHTYIYICSLPLFLSLSLLFLLCRGKTSQRLAIWNVSSTKKWGAFGPKSPFRLIKGWRCHKTLRKKHGQMQQIQQPTSVCSDGEDIFNHGLGCGVRPTPGLNPVEHVNPYIKKMQFSWWKHRLLCTYASRLTQGDF